MEVPVGGRTRWAIFDAASDRFYVNVADPPQIAVIDGKDPARVAHTFPVPAAGPHGLDLDPMTGRLFCACDAGVLVAVEARSGDIVGRSEIGGVPDVVFVNATLRRLYIAIGDPGLIEVFDLETGRQLETVPTERGAHTIAFDPAQNLIYAFLPESHRASVYTDRDIE